MNIVVSWDSRNEMSTEIFFSVDIVRGTCYVVIYAQSKKYFGECLTSRSSDGRFFGPYKRADMLSVQLSKDWY